MVGHAEVIQQSPRGTQLPVCPSLGRIQERLSNVARGLSSQPSGFYLAIWRMRLPFLSSILSSEFSERGVTRHDRFNTRNNFKRIFFCGGEGGRLRGCRPCSMLESDQWHRMEEGRGRNGSSRRAARRRHQSAARWWSRNFCETSWTRSPY